MTQKGQALIFLLVGVLIAVVVGGAFYLGKQAALKPSPVPAVTSQTPQPAATLTPPASSPNETAFRSIDQNQVEDKTRSLEASQDKIPRGLADTSDWSSKTYTNLGISFKVPSTWKDKQEEELNIKNLIRRVYFDDPKSYGSENFAVLLYNNPRNLGRRDFWWEEVIGGKAPFSENGIGSVKDITDWKVEGKDGLSLNFTEYSMGGSYLMITQGKQMLVVYFSGDMLTEQTFETVLSTFRFD